MSDNMVWVDTEEFVKLRADLDKVTRECNEFHDMFYDEQDCYIEVKKRLKSVQRAARGLMRVMSRHGRTRALVLNDGSYRSACPHCYRALPSSGVCQRCSHD